MDTMTIRLNFTQLDAALAAVPETCVGQCTDRSTGELHTWTYSNHKEQIAREVRLFKAAARKVADRILALAQGAPREQTLPTMEAVRRLGDRISRDVIRGAEGAAAVSEACTAVFRELMAACRKAQDLGLEARKAERRREIARLDAQIRARRWTTAAWEI